MPGEFLSVLSIVEDKIYRKLRSMERVLKTVRMEALVSDLSHALDETTASSNGRRRWGLCRRARSTGNLRKSRTCLAFHTTHSDDSDSISEALLNKDRGHSSLHQSDSDDMSPARRAAPFSLQSRHAVPHLHALESDSVNENFSPIRPGTRRRRKLKRMAVDISTEPGLSAASTSGAHLLKPQMLSASGVIPAHANVFTPGSLPAISGALRKKRVLKHTSNCENSYNSIVCGKRKRSLRDRSGGECDIAMIDELVSGVHNHKSKPRGRARGRVRPGGGDECMEISGAEVTSSSPSLSSNESDAGFFTTDEGREGDDEHSDWCGGDGRSFWEDDDDDDDETTMRESIQGGSQQDGVSTFSAPLNISDIERRSIKGGLTGREIRAGRRRLQDNRAGFSVLTSANEKLSRFLQDSSQSELRLHPMQHEERDQLVQLANLYSLQMRLEPTPQPASGLTCPVLTKTRDTVRLEQVAALSAALSRHLHSWDLGLKKRRRLPPGAGATNHNPALSTFVEDLAATSTVLSESAGCSFRAAFTHSNGCKSS